MLWETLHKQKLISNCEFVAIMHFYIKTCHLVTMLVSLQSPLRSGSHELHTLSENEEDELAIELEETSMMEGGRERGKEVNIEAAMTERGREMMGQPVFEETMWNSQLSSEEPFITSTLISSDHSHSLTGMPQEETIYHDMHIEPKYHTE